MGKVTGLSINTEFMLVEKPLIYPVIQLTNLYAK